MDPHERHGFKSRASFRDSFFKDTLTGLGVRRGLVTSMEHTAEVRRTRQNGAMRGFAVSGRVRGEAHDECLSAHCRIRAIISSWLSGPWVSQFPPGAFAAASFATSLPVSSASRSALADPLTMILVYRTVSTLPASTLSW